MRWSGRERSCSASSPGGLGHPGDLATESPGPKADAAHLELPEEGPRTAAQRAAVLLPRGELGLAGRSHHFRSLRHGRIFLSQDLNGIPRYLRRARPSSSVRAVVTMVMFMPFTFSTL